MNPLIILICFIIGGVIGWAVEIKTADKPDYQYIVKELRK